MQHETVIVLDFGGQYNQLIARLSLIHISEPTRLANQSRMPSSA